MATQATKSKFLLELSQAYGTNTKARNLAIMRIVSPTVSIEGLVETPEYTFGYQNDIIGTYWQALEIGDEISLRKARKQLLDGTFGFEVVLEIFSEAEDLNGLIQLGDKYRKNPSRALQAYVNAGHKIDRSLVESLRSRGYKKVANYAEWKNKSR